MRLLFLSFLISLVFESINTGANPTLKSQQPSTSLASDGKIVITGMVKSTSYVINYDFVDANYYHLKNTLNSESITANADGEVEISDLAAGTYSNFSIDNDLTKLSGQTVTLNDQVSMIAANSNVKWNVSLFEAINGVNDDNSTAFTESYLSISIPIRKKSGIPSNSRNELFPKKNEASPVGSRFIWLRNLFLQGDYSTNVGTLPAVYHDTTKNPIRYINQLDALKYSNIRLIGNFNILSYVLPEHYGLGDLGHIYWDAIAGVIGTTIADSTFGNSFLAKTYVYGTGLRVRSHNLKVADVTIPLGFEFGWQLLFLNTSSNEVSPTMNDQYSSRVYNTIQNPINSSRPFTAPFQPYQHLDMLLYYNTGKSDDTLSSSNIYFHASLYSNFKNSQSSTPYFANSYLQFQLGYSLSINKLVSTLKGNN